MTMPDPWTLVSTPTVDLLGWTLLHFVWQGALVAALLAGALWALRRHAPQVRYAVSLAALGGLLALPVATGALLSKTAGSERPDAALAVAEAPAADESIATPPGTAIQTAETDAGTSWVGRVRAWFRPALPGAVLGWSLGVLLFAARWAGGAWRVRRLRGTSDPAPTEWRDRLAALANRVGVDRPVALRRSARVEGPMVTGWWRPVVLVPAGLLSGLPPNQVEALLLHELAHIRRHDVLVGHLQALVETLLFFHPATWWVSGRVRAAREACCDDLAAEHGRDRTVVARALAALAERVAGEPARAWAPAASDGSLLGRVRRLLTPPSGPPAHTQRLSMVAAVLLVAGVSLGLAACASQQSTTEAEPGKEATAAAPADSVEKGDNVVVLRTDSTERVLRFGAGGPVAVDRLDDGAYVLRYDGRTDTLDGPRMDELPEVGAWTSPPLPFDPDSLARTILSGIDPEGIERAVRRGVAPDSLARAIQDQINADSLERALRLRINPDSIEREALEMRLRADSLARRHREHADSLRRRMEQMRDRVQREMPERLREQAERLEERAREMEAPEPPTDPTPPDSGRG